MELLGPQPRPRRPAGGDDAAGGARRRRRALGRSSRRPPRRCRRCTGAAARLAEWLAQPPFAGTPRGGRPAHPARADGSPAAAPVEPEGRDRALRALGMALTAASGQLLPLDERAGGLRRPLADAGHRRLRRGAAGPRRHRPRRGRPADLALRERGRRRQQAPGGALPGHPLGSLRFENELRDWPRRAGATGWRCWRRCRSRPPAPASMPADLAPVQAKLGDVGGLIEADVKLTATIAQAQRAGRRTASACCCAWPPARPRRSARPPTAPAPRRMKLLRSDAARAELAAVARPAGARCATCCRLAGMAA